MDIEVVIALVSRSVEPPTWLVGHQDPVLVVLDHWVVAEREPPAR
jgi:hypothetical protein